MIHSKFSRMPPGNENYGRKGNNSIFGFSLYTTLCSWNSLFSDTYLCITFVNTKMKISNFPKMLLIPKAERGRHSACGLLSRSPAPSWGAQGGRRVLLTRKWGQRGEGGSKGHGSMSLFSGPCVGGCGATTGMFIGVTQGRRWVHPWVQRKQDFCDQRYWTGG